MLARLDKVLGFGLFVLILWIGSSASKAQNPTEVVNDNFSDGITNNGLRQIGFNIIGSSTGALDLSQPGGPLDFASGDSPRSIHGLFTPQTLAFFGDTLEVVFDFTTPDSIAFDNGGPSLNEDFRFGLFNTAPALETINPNTDLPVDFNGPIFTGAISFNPVLTLIPGFVAGLENINSPESEIALRTHNVNSLPNTNPPSGILLLTANGFDVISAGADNTTPLIPNSNFQGRLFVEFSDSSLTSFDITAEITDAAGSFLDLSLIHI